jgi:SAM-dependent methyltransferase
MQCRLRRDLHLGSVWSLAVPEKPPRIPPVQVVRAIDLVRGGLQRLTRLLAPGGVNLLDLATGGWTTQTLYVAAKLGIPDQLGGGPLRADEVARRVGADPDAVYRLMRALASRGVLRHRRNGTFALTSIGKALRTGTPSSMRDLVLFVGHPLRWEDWGNLLHSVRTGEPAVKMLRGTDFFDYLNTDTELAESFNNAMTAGSEFSIYGVLAAYDFNGFRTIVDIGGGHGRLLAMILGKAPGAKGVLFDLPAVVDGAGPELKRAGVANRCTVASGSFFDSVPEGGDAYLMKAILHDWPDDDALRIMRNIRSAMAPDGKLLLLEAVLPERSSWHIGMLIDLEMLVAVGGRERTHAEWANLLGRAGFRLDRIVETATPVAIIEAVPV